MSNELIHFLFIITPLTITVGGVFYFLKIWYRKKWGEGGEHFECGFNLQKQNKIDEALREYEYAIEKNGTLWQPYFNAAGIYHNRGEYDKALKYVKAVIKLRPRFGRGYFHLGKTLQAKGLEIWNWDEAIKSYNKALELGLPYKEKLQCHFILANTYLELGKFDKLEEEIRHLLKLAPQNKEINAFVHHLYHKGLIKKR